MFPSEILIELEKNMNSNDQDNGSHFIASHDTDSSVSYNFSSDDKKSFLRLIEDDRERHKHIRDDAWASDDLEDVFSGNRNFTLTIGKYSFKEFLRPEHFEASYSLLQLWTESEKMDWCNTFKKRQSKRR